MALHILTHHHNVIGWRVVLHDMWTPPTHYIRLQCPGGLHGNTPSDHSLATLAPDFDPKILKHCSWLPCGLSQRFCLKSFSCRRDNDPLSTQRAFPGPNLAILYLYSKSQDQDHDYLNAEWNSTGGCQASWCRIGLISDQCRKVSDNLTSLRLLISKWVGAVSNKADFVSCSRTKEGDPGVSRSKYPTLTTCASNIKTTLWWTNISVQPS